MSDPTEVTFSQELSAEPDPSTRGGDCCSTPTVALRSVDEFDDISDCLGESESSPLTSEICVLTISAFIPKGSLVM